MTMTNFPATNANGPEIPQNRGKPLQSRCTHDQCPPIKSPGHDNPSEHPSRLGDLRREPVSRRRSQHRNEATKALAKGLDEAFTPNAPTKPALAQPDRPHAMAPLLRGAPDDGDVPGLSFSQPTQANAVFAVLPNDAADRVDDVSQG